MKCRHCRASVSLLFLDLGSAPPSNAYRSAAQVAEPELRLPLRLLVCTACWLVQTEDFAGREALFTDDYAYFSSVSSTWVAHAERYVADMVACFSLGAGSTVEARTIMADPRALTSRRGAHETPAARSSMGGSACPAGAPSFCTSTSWR